MPTGTITSLTYEILEIERTQNSLRPLNPHATSSSQSVPSVITIPTMLIKAIKIATPRDRRCLGVSEYRFARRYISVIIEAGITSR